MAQSYIGKIAGIVTLNTRDVTAGVNRSVKELDNLGKSIRGIITSSNTAAGKSFDAIFTPLQKLQAAVRAANSQPLNLVNAKQIQQIEALSRATRGIFDPLAEGTKQFGLLGANAQAAFLPALEQIQNKALLINRAIAETGTLGPKSYATMQRQVEATTQAVTRLGEATRLAARGQTGNELAFRSPRANEALSGSAAAREAAGGLSAGRLASSNIANQVRFLADLDNKIIETQARIERIRLQPRVDTEELEQYEQRLRSLVKTSKVTQDSINQIVAADKRAQSANGLRSFNDLLADTNTQRAIGEFRALEQVVVRLGDKAGKQVSGAFEQLRSATQRAVQAGTTGVPAVRRELERLQRAAAIAAADTGKISFNNALKQIQRGGDIASKGFGNVQLASQQALFAVDDFFSVTGGFEQRIRAVGNNLTQLGVILGGAKGLFIALGVVLAAQASVQIAKWVGAIGDAKSQADAFKKALEGQKSAIEQLNRAFVDFSNDVANDAFEATTDKVKELRSETARLISELQRASKDSAIQLVPSVLQSQGRLSAAEGRIEQTANNGGRTWVDYFRGVSVESSVSRQLREQIRERDRAAASLSRERRSARDRVSGDGRNGIDRAFLAQQQLAIKEIFSGFQPIIDAANEAGVVGAGALTNTLGDIAARLKASVGNLDAASTETDFGRRVILERLGEAGINKVLQDLQGGIADNVAALAPATAAINLFTQALESSGRALADSVASEAASAFEQAQRAVNAATASRALGLGGADDERQAFEQQRRLELASNRAASLREDQLRADQQARDAAVNDPLIGGLTKRLADLQRAAADNTLGEAERADARLSADELTRVISLAVARLPESRRARDLGDLADVTLQQALQREDLLSRGRGLNLSPGQQAGRDLFDSINTLREVARTDGIDTTAAQRRIQEETFRGLAPTLFGLQDQVQNAILRGPSRAALNPTDVSTVEGSRELTRLLRGDDEARNQDLVALTKEGNDVLRAIEKKLELENAN
jgi:hypothetical protein